MRPVHAAVQTVMYRI